MERQPWSHFQAVRFVVVHFGELIVASALHNYVAGGAGIIPAAGMFQLNAVVQANIQQGFRFPVVGVWQFPLFELDGLSLWQNRNFRHYFIVALPGSCNERPGASISRRISRSRLCSGLQSRKGFGCFEGCDGGPGSGKAHAECVDRRSTAENPIGAGWKISKGAKLQDLLVPH